MRKQKYVCGILVGKPFGKLPFGRLKTGRMIIKWFVLKKDGVF
jgi:hypothetical protein